MIDASEFGLSGVLYQAGSVAPPGVYRRIDRPGRAVEIRDAGPLPPSFDGGVALYHPAPIRASEGAR